MFQIQGYLSHQGKTYRVTMNWVTYALRGGGKGEERKSECREEILFLELQVLQKASGNSVTKITD